MNQEQIELIKKRVAGSADVDHPSYMKLAETAFKRDIPALLHDHNALTRQLERATRVATMWEFAYKGSIAKLHDRRKGGER